MRKNYYLKCVALLVLMVSVFSSCKREMDKYYDDRDKSKDNAWELLEREGTYSIYLEGIERIGLKALANGYGISTFLAPDDDAFNAYFAKVGKSSLADFTDAEVLDLIGFHIVYYSYTKDMFANYRPNGAVPPGTVEPNKGIYYKFKTYSKDPYEVKTLVNSDGYSRERKVYHLEKFVPMFSNYYFSAFAITDPATEYKYWFPNSELDQTGSVHFNIANSKVTEYAVPVNNGFVYRLEEVLEPMPTVYQYLQANAEGANDANSFTVFRDSYDRFASYAYNSDLTANYGDSSTDSIFLPTYQGSLPNIKAEWSDTVATELATLSSRSLTILPPSDEAMNNLFAEYWQGYGYANYRDLDFEIIKLLLYSNVTNGNYAYLPEYFSLYGIYNNNADVIDFNLNDNILRKLCNNGVIYGMNRVQIPKSFDSSVLSPVFRDKNYRMMMRMVAMTQEPIFINDLSDVKFFISSDDVLKQSSITYGTSTPENVPLDWEETNTSVYGGQRVVMITQEENVNLSSYYAGLFVQGATALEAMTPGAAFNETDGIVYKTRSQFNYIMLKGGRIYSARQMARKQTAPEYRQITDTYGTPNGTTYEIVYNVGGAQAPVEEQMVYSAALSDAGYRPSEFNAFVELLGSSDMLATGFDFTQGDRVLFFIPSAEAIANGKLAGKVPPVIVDGDANINKNDEPIATGEQSLADIKRIEMREYLKRYMINVTTSPAIAGDYPFPSNGQVGAVTTFYADEVDGRLIYRTLQLGDTGSAVTVTDQMGNIVSLTQLLPYMYTNGGAYAMSGLLEMSGDENYLSNSWRDKY